MKLFAAGIIALFAFTISFAQNEQSPIVEKDIMYKNWKYPLVATDEKAELRDLVKGNKLTILVYWAPWCHNWQHDAPFLEKFYEKYHKDGLEIVGIGEYDPVESMKLSLTEFKITFPVVYESINRSQKQKTDHYTYRTSTGDARNWGSPYYVLLTPSMLEKKGDTVTKHTNVINGEMIETEGEAFIRKALGLPPTDPKASASSSNKAEVCDPDAPATLKLPPVKKP
ncbi:MAG: TlpA family protein disulfide reductase [Acidobacteria bacterium]|nr:TlpA family protein disulfide reductase [Acidobacteriota bacterium]